MYSWPWASKVSLPRGISCRLGRTPRLAEEESRLASWQHQMFLRRKPKFFPLDILVFSFTTDQSCYSGWQRSSYCGSFCWYRVCARGSWFLPSEPLLSLSGSFICKCHLLWQTTGPETVRDQWVRSWAFRVGVLGGPWGFHFQGALVDPHYLASIIELMSHWMVSGIWRATELLFTTSNVTKCFYMRMCLESWVLGHFHWSLNNEVKTTRAHTHTHHTAHLKLLKHLECSHPWAQPWFWNWTETEWLEMRTPPLSWAFERPQAP